MPAPRARSRRRRRALAALAFGAVFVLAVLIVQPLSAYTLLGSVLPGILWRVETSEPIVALTFDDGPDPTFTPQVLEILARHQAHATFFLIAERALQRPDLRRSHPCRGP